MVSRYIQRIPDDDLLVSLHKTQRVGIHTIFEVVSTSSYLQLDLPRCNTMTKMTYETTYLDRIYCPALKLSTNPGNRPKSCLKNATTSLLVIKGAVSRKTVSFAEGIKSPGTKIYKDNVKKPRRLNSFLDNPNW